MSIRFPYLDIFEHFLFIHLLVYLVFLLPSPLQSVPLSHVNELKK